MLIFDFRRANWRMTRSEVKLSEKVYPLSENKTHITYRDRYMNLDAVVGFHFEEDALIEAGYVFPEFIGDRKDYINEYQRITDNLIQIYGMPIIENNNKPIPMDYYSLDSREDINIHLVEWECQRSIIRFLFAGQDNYFEFGVLFFAKDNKEHINLSLN